MSTAAKLRKIALIAGEIAITTPARPTSEYGSAYVAWALIIRLREALTAAGYDLDAARAEFNRLTAEAEARRRHYDDGGGIQGGHRRA